MALVRSSTGWLRRFAAGELFVVCCIILALGYTLWRGWQAQFAVTDAHPVPAVRQTLGAKSAHLPHQYVNVKGHFSLIYPDSWRLIEQPDVYINDGSVYAESATLVSPRGTELRLRGDDSVPTKGCVPAAQDKPWRTGNRCATQQYLTDEPLFVGDVALTASTASILAQKASVRLVARQFGLTPDAMTYGIGLAAVADGQSVPLRQPNMGTYEEDAPITVYDAMGNVAATLYASATSRSADFLASQDAQDVRNILRTLQISLP